MTVVKFRRQLDHGDLPCETEEPNECKDDCNSVELVMYQFVMLVHLKYESVVDVVAAEDLNCETSTEQNEAYYSREIVRVNACVNLAPIRVAIGTWRYREEDKKRGQDEKTSTEERDEI